MKLFEQLDYDPLPVEEWGLMFRLWAGAPLNYIPEPTEAVILEECVEKHMEFALAHNKALDEGGMTFNQSIEWSEQSLAWARFWAVRDPDSDGREVWIKLARDIEDDLARCAGRVRELWRKQGLHSKMVNGKLVLTPIKGDRDGQS
jgi:hypothetical protein